MRTLLLDQFQQDVRCAWRTLRKNPGFTAVAIVTFALGIGANTAMFGVVNAVLLRPLPFPNHERIVHIWATNPGRGLTRAPVSPADFLDWRKQNRAFERLTAARFSFHTLAGQGTSEQLHGMRVSPGFFSTLGIQPALGRTFRLEEDQPGHDRVVIITHGLWQRRFAADPTLIGKTVSLDAEPHTVVGVLPSNFWFYPILGKPVEVWMPFAFGPSEFSRDARSVMVHGLLKSGVTIESARTELATIARRLEQQYPNDNTGWGTRIDAGILSNEEIQPQILLLFAAAGFLLLIACANVANLMRARSMYRVLELEVRAALGASRARLIRQSLVESTLLGALGSAAGLILGVLWLQMLATFVPPRLEAFFAGGLESLQLDGRMLAFSLGAALFCGVISGLLPAAQACSPNLGDALTTGGRGSGGVRSRRQRDSLMVLQVGLAVTLSIGAGLMIRSLWELHRFDRGLNTANVLTMQVRPAERRYAEPHQIVDFHRRILERTAILPEVVSASAISFLHLSESSVGWTFSIEGRPALFPEQVPNALYYVVAPGYLRTMEIPLLKGRHLAFADSARAPAVAVIDEKLAQRYWPGEDPIGRRFRFDPLDAASEENPSHAHLTFGWITVVGVARTVLGDGLWDNGAPVIYLPFQQNPSRMMHLVIRTERDPLHLADAVQRIVWEIDPDQPVSFIRTMEEVSAWAFAGRRLTMQLLAVFAVLATLLAAAGIYAVITYAVSQRTQELGIRIALGARRPDVMRTVLWRGLASTAFGMVLGLVGAMALTRYLEGMLFGLTPLDPTTFISVAALFGAVVTIALYVPAKRAASVDPLVALRHQ